MKPYYESDTAVIYHGDCRDVLRDLPSATIDVIWTDPPYGHANADGDLLSRRAEAVKDGRATKLTPIANDHQDDMRAVVDVMLTEASRLLKPDASACCVCCGGGGPTPTFAWLALRMDQNGLDFFHSVIWDKKNPGMGWRFRRQHEMIMVSHRSGGTLRWNEERGAAIPNILSYYPPRERLHPNEKPLELIAAFLSSVSKPGDTVLDPFMGSGSTLVAALACGRKAIGIELSEEYCELAATRLSSERGAFAGTSKRVQGRSGADAYREAL